MRRLILLLFLAEAEASELFCSPSASASSSLTAATVGSVLFIDIFGVVVRLLLLLLSSLPLLLLRLAFNVFTLGAIDIRFRVLIDDADFARHPLQNHSPFGMDFNGGVSHSAWHELEHVSQHIR